MALSKIETHISFDTYSMKRVELIRSARSWLLQFQGFKAWAKVRAAMDKASYPITLHHQKQTWDGKYHLDMFAHIRGEQVRHSTTIDELSLPALARALAKDETEYSNELASRVPYIGETGLQKWLQSALQGEATPVEFERRQEAVVELLEEARRLVQSIQVPDYCASCKKSPPTEDGTLCAGCSQDQGEQARDIRASHGGI